MDGGGVMRPDGATHCYIGKSKCGCVVAACVDLPMEPKWTAEALAEFIADGFTIERVTIDDARLKLNGCVCDGQQTTLKLETV